MDATPQLQNPGIFSNETFELLGQLHQNPKYAFYEANKQEFEKHLIRPFRRLVEEVSRLLSKEISSQLETKKDIFSRMRKNDYGVGGAYDHYWAAFYPKGPGHHRVRDAQLAVIIKQDKLAYGFHIGIYGKEAKSRFIQNFRRNPDELKQLLQSNLSDTGFTFGNRNKTATFDHWLQQLNEDDIPIQVVSPKEVVLRKSLRELATDIANVFERLFPLILIASSDKPVTMLRDYLHLDSGSGGATSTMNSPYPLEKFAEETGFNTSELARFIRGIERKGQGIIYGPPGTGKTYLSEMLAKHLTSGEDGFYELIQFHSSYSYEDFIQGIRPQVQDDGRLDYSLVPGRFLEFIRRARSKTGLCLLVLDEINRTNLSRVFGELMYLLEYRNRSVSLAAGGSLTVPPNVRLIGTMNTADRSIALVDYALRRRFAFLGLYPNYEILRSFLAKSKSTINIDGLLETLQRLNTQIGDRNYQLGVSFFLDKELTTHIEDIWTMEIEPYLEEYFFAEPTRVEDFRWEKVRKTIVP